MRWNPDGKKKELWEQQKSAWQVYAIHIRVWFRKFQRETKGLGILFIILIVVLVVLELTLPFIAESFKSEKELRIEEQAYCFKYGCTMPVMLLPFA